jgi:hypothetical protein
MIPALGAGGPGFDSRFRPLNTSFVKEVAIEISSSRVFFGSRYGASDGKESERRLFFIIGLVQLV